VENTGIKREFSFLQSGFTDVGPTYLYQNLNHAMIWGTHSAAFSKERIFNECEKVK